MLNQIYNTMVLASKLGDDDPLNPSPTPDPVLLCVKGKRTPDNSYPCFYTVCEARDDVHQ